jgi:monooxygenase
MASDAAHVTMLQRSPTYILSQPSEDPIGKLFHRVLPTGPALSAARWSNILRQIFFYNLAQRRPELVKRIIKKLTVKQLPADFDVDTHFSPRYNPWDERLCAVPDGDLFRSLRKGEASVVTDHIETFDETGIQLKSGDHLDADIIITATGLNILLFGDMQLAIDGEPVDFSTRMAYKGMMLEGVPNYAFQIGYTNSSWTLKADLAGEYIGKLIALMRSRGDRQVMPEGDPTLERRPLLDFQAGYVQRAAHLLPKQGNEFPWTVKQNYLVDRKMFKSEINDGTLKFSAPARTSPAAAAEAATA